MAMNEREQLTANTRRRAEAVLPHTYFANDLGNLGRDNGIGSERWLRELFPDKDWHRHPRTDGHADLCDGTPSDCAEKERL